jgi:hypothetical protein
MQSLASQTPGTTDTLGRIRERAYAIWQTEGCPDGCAEQHRSAAEAEILRSDATPDRAANGADASQAAATRKRRRT